MLDLDTRRGRALNRPTSQDSTATATTNTTETTAAVRQPEWIITEIDGTPV
jgi:hypothetical protein